MLGRSKVYEYMGERLHLTNTIGLLLGGKVTYAVMLEAVGRDTHGYFPSHQG